MILVHAIISTLPDSWPKESIHSSLKQNFHDLRDLGSMLEEIEIDLEDAKAADEVEQRIKEGSFGDKWYLQFR